jgi:hypothetical protein
VTIEQTKAYRQLDAEYGAAVLYAIAILRAHGMNSPEFKVAEDAACDLWLRLREFRFAPTKISATPAQPHRRSYSS